MNTMLQTIQLPSKVCNNTVSFDYQSYQQALPICTPACPMWIEITSLMVNIIWLQIICIKIRADPKRGSNLLELGWFMISNHCWGKHEQTYSYTLIINELNWPTVTFWEICVIYKVYNISKLKTILKQHFWSFIFWAFIWIQIEHCP